MYELFFRACVHDNIYFYENILAVYKNKTMKILITGIHGFIGSNLTASLQAMYIIYGLSTVASRKMDRPVKVYSWKDLDKVPQIDVVIHLAGVAHDVKNRTAGQVYIDVNVGLTKRIFDWSLRSGVKKFIFFSSVKAAADTVEGILSEETMPSPKGLYGESKLAAEEYIRKNSGNMSLSSMRLYILRPSMVHGRGNKGNLNLLYGITKKGLPWPLGAFENRRSFASIDNVTYIIKELIDRQMPSGIYNIADDEALSTNEIIQIICETIPCKCRIWNINKMLVVNAAALGSILRLPLNKERLKKLTENYIVSNKKIKEALNINCLPFSASEGFIKTVHSFKSQVL
jgi:nucleoside-diphosphate-sugar epimerase